MARASQFIFLEAFSYPLVSSHQSLIIMSTDPESLPGLEIDELLAKIKRSHTLYYKMINIEIWALVETLDQFFPGAWNRFMTNRQTSMKQFLERQRNKTKSPSKEENPDQ